MSGSQSALAVSVFLACTVEAVEALTIVLAVGTTRSWRSALYGVGAGVLALAVVVAALGPAVGSVPIGTLRVLDEHTVAYLDLVGSGAANQVSGQAP